MKKVFCVLLAVLLLSATGCGKQQQTAGQPEVSYDYTSLVKPAVDISFEDCLSVQTVSDIFGQPMMLVGVYADGTQGIYATEDSTTRLTVNLQKINEAGYEELIGSLPGTQEALEDLPFPAVWYNALELFCYVGGHAVEIIATVPGEYVPQEESVAVARAIADHL